MDTKPILRRTFSEGTDPIEITTSPISKLLLVGRCPGVEYRRRKEQTKKEKNKTNNTKKKGGRRR